MPIAIDLSERVCLVVGGSGGGIGSAAALACADAGADIGVITNLEEHGRDTAEQVEARGRRCSVALCDVTDEAALVEAVAKVARELGTIQHLVNVVGGALADDWSRTAEYDMAAFDRIVARNLRYAVVACREVGRELIEAGLPGSIVNLSAVFATRGTPLLAAYGAAKAGLESFSRTMALEWGQYGIRVNLVAPGTIRTPRAGESALKEATASIPLGRRGVPADIANAAVFLLSELASYVTGQTLVVDGGSAMGPGGEQLPAFVTNPIVRARFGG